MEQKNKISNQSNRTQLTLSELEDVLIFFSNSLVTKETEEEVVWDIASNCISKLGYVDCVIYLFNETKTRLIQKAAYGPKSPKLNRISNPIEIIPGLGISGSVARSGIPEIIKDTRHEKRYIRDDEVRLSEIAVPIKTGNEILGVIDCEHPELGFFNEQDLKILSFIARLCAVKLKNIQIEKSIRDNQLKLLNAEKEISKLQLESFNSQINPHFLFNAFNAIQHFIIKNEQKATLQYLSHLGKLIRKNISHIGNTWIEVEEELKSLDIYIALQKMRYDKEIQIKKSIDNNTRKYKIPGMILQTLFENTIEQFPHSESNPLNLTFSLTKNKDKIHILMESSESEPLSSKRNSEYRKELISWEDQIIRYSTLLEMNIYYEKLKIEPKGTKMMIKIPIVDPT